MLRIVAIALLLACGSAYASAPPTKNPSQQPAATSAAREKNEQKPSESFWRRTIDDPVDLYTALLTIFTGVLAVSTIGLWKSTNKDSKRQAKETRQLERAFIHLDDFITELTTAEDVGTDISLLPEEFRELPHLYITRFAIRPIWKNSGNTPVKTMAIRVNWFGPASDAPDYSFKEEPQSFFIAPHATAGSEFVEIPSARDLIIAETYPVKMKPGKELKVLIWGRADYTDIFGFSHFTEWCYRVRFDAHKGKGLGINFIQWGDYNRTDNEEENG